MSIWLRLLCDLGKDQDKNPFSDAKLIGLLILNWVAPVGIIYLPKNPLVTLLKDSGLTAHRTLIGLFDLIAEDLLSIDVDEDGMMNWQTIELTLPSDALLYSLQESDESFKKEIEVTFLAEPKRIDYRPKPVKRKPIRTHKRFKILKRDDYRCQLCGRSPKNGDEVELHIDHKVPFSKGGGNDLDNLWVLCRECNISKRDELL